MLDFIIPIYKINEEYIKQLINSLNIQKYHNLFNCVFIIDEPKPMINYRALISKQISKDIRYKIIYNKDNYGLGISRNIGIKNSNNKYVAFIDSDDKISHNYTEIIINTIKQYHYPKVVKINYLVTAKQYNNIYKVDKVNKTKIKAWASWLFIVSRELIEKNKIYFLNEKIIYEDVYWFFMLMKNINYWIEINQKLYLYTNDRQYSIMNTNKNLFLNIKLELNILKKAKNNFNNSIKFKYSTIRKWLIIQLFKKFFNIIK